MDKWGAEFPVEKTTWTRNVEWKIRNDVGGLPRQSKTPHFQCRGAGSIPGWGSEIPQATMCSKKHTNDSKAKPVVSPVPPHLLAVLWEILALGLRHGLPSEVFIRMHILALDWGFQEARFHGKECYKPALLLSPLDRPNNWICSMCQFPWCKYPHCGWLQAASTEWELGRDTHIQHS